MIIIGLLQRLKITVIEFVLFLNLIILLNLIIVYFMIKTLLARWLVYLIFYWCKIVKIIFRLFLIFRNFIIETLIACWLFFLISHWISKRIIDRSNWFSRFLWDLLTLLFLRMRLSWDSRGLNFNLIIIYSMIKTLLASW